MFEAMAGKHQAKMVGMAHAEAGFERATSEGVRDEGVCAGGARDGGADVTTETARGTRSSKQLADQPVIPEAAFAEGVLASWLRRWLARSHASLRAC